MTKNELRDKYKKLRTSLTQAEIGELSLGVANTLLKMDIWNYSNYHIFLTMVKNKEIDTTPIITILEGKNKTIIIPKSNFKDLSMTHFLLTEETFIKENSLGIPEPINGPEVKPEMAQVVFIPLLAFDRSGYRVGYGKGFYDRFLSVCKPQTLRIGLSLFEAEHVITDTDVNDIPMDLCVTPDKIYDFRS